MKQSPDKKTFFVMYLLKSINNESSALIVNTYNNEMTLQNNKRFKIDATAEDVFNEVTATIDAFKGLSYLRVGTQGAPIAKQVNQPVDARS